MDLLSRWIINWLPNHNGGLEKDNNESYTMLINSSEINNIISNRWSLYLAVLNFTTATANSSLRFRSFCSNKTIKTAHLQTKKGIHTNFNSMSTFITIFQPQ